MKKGIDTERKKKSSNNKLNRAGEQWQKKVQKQYIKKKKSFYLFLLTFYSLTRHMIYFAGKILMQKSQSNLGIKKSAGCLSLLCLFKKNFSDARNNLKVYFLYEPQKCSHKRWLEQAYNTNTQAFV